MRKLILFFKDGEEWRIDIDGKLVPNYGKTNEETFDAWIKKIIETDGPFETINPLTKEPLIRSGSEVARYEIK